MKADLILNNARIKTFDPRHPQADSLVVSNGRILAVGQAHEFANLIGAETTCLDMGGRTVLPGFIDAHQHLSWFSEEPLKLNCATAHTPSLEALKMAVAQTAASLPAGHATYAHPRRLPEGIAWVLVNGVPAIADGQPTGATAGQFLLKWRAS